MTRNAQRHRSRDLRKHRAGKGTGAPEVAAPLAAFAAPPPPKGKGVPIIVCGHTLSEIARALDLDQSYVSKLAAGKATPSLKVAWALQAYLGLGTLEQALEALTEEAREREGL